MNECLAALRRHGLLLQSDAKLPSVSALVAGAPVRGSWWAHPKAHEIFHTLEALSEHPDVLLLKLIARKSTFVHRRLWPEIYLIATAGERWQWEGLPKDARALQRRLAEAGRVEVTGMAARELEYRLLARGEQFHTDAGHHSRRLESWTEWAARVGLEQPEIDLVQANRTIEEVFPGARFPWKVTRRQC